MSIALELTDDLVAALFGRARELGLIEESRGRFLSKEALAEHLGVSPRTIKTWRERGLPGHRVGREVMFEVSEVERWIEREGQ